MGLEKYPGIKLDKIQIKNKTPLFIAMAFETAHL